MLPKNSVVTGYLALEYHSLLDGAFLVRVEHQKEGKIFRFSFKANDKYRLEFSFAPPSFLLQGGWTKRDDAFEIWQECSGTIVTRVSPVAGNRAMIVEIRKDTEGALVRNFKIVFEMFGAQANAFLLDESDTILHALRVVKNDRRLKPGAKYVTSDTVGKTEESGVVDIATVGATKYLLEFDSRHHKVVTEPPSKLELDRKTPLVSLFQSLHEAQSQQLELGQARASALGSLKQEIKKHERTLAQLNQDLEQCREAEQLKQWGDLLMANLDAKPEKEHLRLADFYHGDKMIKVPLVAGKTVLTSAATYYKRAKRLQRMPEIIKPRIAKIEQTVARLLRQSELIKQAADLDQLRKLAAIHPVQSHSKSSDKTGVSETSTSYRTFYSSSDEKILVGKSAAGNDVLTFKVARTYDWWFHAQQAAGSHVVLVVNDKNRAPSKKSVTEAAQLAAYYSDMKKSHHVPVMYAERRYVRKAKGGAPGKVVLPQFKSIFVSPQLPPTVSEDKVDLR